MWVISKNLSFQTIPRKAICQKVKELSDRRHSKIEKYFLSIFTER